MTTGSSDDELLPDELLADEASPEQLLPDDHASLDEADEGDVLEQELEVPDDDEDYERG
jgi:hypothetical protein